MEYGISNTSNKYHWKIANETQYQLILLHREISILERCTNCYHKIPPTFSTFIFSSYRGHWMII